MKNHLYFDLIPFWIIIFMPVFLFLVNSKKNKLKKYYNNIYFKVFFIFCLILIFSSLMSENIWKSLKNSFFYFRFGIFTLCFWYILDKNVDLIRYL